METMSIEEFIQDAVDYQQIVSPDVETVVRDSQDIRMSSRELFEYVKQEEPSVRYNNFNVSISRLLERLKIDHRTALQSDGEKMNNRLEHEITEGITVVTHYGKFVEYIFNRRWSLMVAATFNDKARLAVIDRMIELEQEVARLNKEMADKFERYLSGNPLFIRVRDLQRHMRLNNADYKAVMEYMQDESVTGKYAFRKSLLADHLVETITFTNAANVQLEVHSVSPRMVLKLDDWLKLTPAQRGIRGKK